MDFFFIFERIFFYFELMIFKIFVMRMLDNWICYNVDVLYEVMYLNISYLLFIYLLIQF